MKKRNKRIFWVVVLLVLVSVSTLSVLGYKKSHNNKDKDENNVVNEVENNNVEQNETV